MKKSLSRIIGICVLFLPLLGVLFRFAPQYTMWRVLLTVALMILMIVLFALDMQPIASRTIDVSLLSEHYDKQQISRRYMLALINRTFVFPCVLTVYLVYLLLQQTQLRGLDMSIRYAIINENFLLVLTILSGIALVYQQETDETYMINKKSLSASYAYLVLSIVLGLLSTYIIYIQTEALGTIGSVISVIAGLLVFLVGVLLMEEEEET